MREADSNHWRILANFKSKEAAAEFLAMTAGGLEWAGEKP